MVYTGYTWIVHTYQNSRMNSDRLQNAINNRTPSLLDHHPHRFSDHTFQNFFSSTVTKPHTFTPRPSSRCRHSDLRKVGTIGAEAHGQPITRSSAAMTCGMDTQHREFRRLHKEKSSEVSWAKRSGSCRAYLPATIVQNDSQERLKTV